MLPAKHLPCCDTKDMALIVPVSPACWQWHYFYNAQCEPASVISSLNTATAGFQVRHPVAEQARCRHRRASVRLFRQLPACCCACRPAERRRPGSTPRRSNRRQR